MRIKVGMAIYQPKTRFKCFYRPLENFNLIKGTLHNEQKKIQCMNSSTIPDCLDDARCSGFFIDEVHMILFTLITVFLYYSAPPKA